MTRRFVVSGGGSVTGVEAADLPEPDATPLAGSLRLDVVALDPQFAAGAGFELLVYVNYVEMTRIGAGMGMDPRDVLLPENQLVAIAKPHTVAIARCQCGHHGCAGTDVTITRRGDLVHWDWLHATPIDRSVVFDAAEYDREIARIANDVLGLFDCGQT
jgi:hypothetical protein